MKKILTVNLNGTVYYIDEDAYSLLKKYLNNIKYYFRSEEGVEEIMCDIEARIAELFTGDLTSPLSVITKKRVEEVIEQLGKPEEIAGNERVYNEAQKTQEQIQKKRKLYRNPDDKMLGGVISGLALFLGVDITILRLIIVLILVFGVGTLIPVYVVCWLIIPEAKTAEEKLTMRGEEINFNNIGKTVTESFDRAHGELHSYMHSKKNRTGFQRFIDGLVGVLGFLLKAGLIVLALIIGVPTLFVLFVLFLALVIGGIAALVGGGFALFSLFPLFNSPFFSDQPLLLFVSSISGLIVFGLPIFSLLYILFQRVFQWKNMSSGIKIGLIILWFLALGILIFGLLQVNWTYVESINTSLVGI